MTWTVLLAAGASRRMGSPKALLPLSSLRSFAGPQELTATTEGPAPPGPRIERSFLEQILITASAGGCAGAVVVLGPPHADAIRSALPVGVAQALNPDPARGMLSSVQAGVRVLPAEASGALVWPVDMPLVRPETVRAIADAGEAGRHRLVLPRHQGRGGHPLWIPRARFAELLGLDPERGLRALVEARPDEVERIEVKDPGVLVDFDTPQDCQRPRTR